MEGETQNLPSEKNTTKIVEQVVNQSVLKVERFAPSACLFVYDVVTEIQQNFLGRMIEEIFPFQNDSKIRLPTQRNLEAYCSRATAETKSQVLF
jgi:hypothetical protein